LQAKKKTRRIPWYALILAVAFLAVLTTVVIKFITQIRVANDELIAEQVVQLQQIFTRINDRCKITNFRHKKDHLDFLNVISFAGSVVGPMNLLEPQNWEGPYLQENLTIGGIEYEIVGTKTGYYIVPGDGVELSNGQVIGKSLIITPQSNIENMIRDPQALMSNNRPLAAKIPMYETLFEKLRNIDYADVESTA
jgi:hypothetical protein